MFCIKGKAMSNNAMSNETDLDWLARNVNVWPVNAKFAVRPGMGEVLFYEHHYSHLVQFSREQVEARRAELQNKPGWDHETVPAWATALAQDQDGEWKWLGDNVTQYVDGFTADKIRAQCKGVVLGSWRDTLEKRPYISVTNCTVTSSGSFSVTVGAPVDLSEQAVTARLQEATDNVLAAAKELKRDKYKFDPFIGIEDNQEQVLTQQQDNGWFERGELPPVGKVCLYVVSDRLSAEVEITAHAKFGLCFVEVGKSGENYVSKTAELHRFRPVRTERDVLLSIIVEEMNRYDTDGKLADAILVAGFSLRDK